MATRRKVFGLPHALTSRVATLMSSKKLRSCLRPNPSISITDYRPSAAGGRKCGPFIGDFHLSDDSLEDAAHDSYEDVNDLYSAPNKSVDSYEDVRDLYSAPIKSVHRYDVPYIDNPCYLLWDKEEDSILAVSDNHYEKPDEAETQAENVITSDVADACYMISAGVNTVSGDVVRDPSTTASSLSVTDIEVDLQATRTLSSSASQTSSSARTDCSGVSRDSPVDNQSHNSFNNTHSSSRVLDAEMVQPERTTVSLFETAAQHQQRTGRTSTGGTTPVVVEPDNMVSNWVIRSHFTSILNDENDEWSDHECIHWSKPEQTCTIHVDNNSATNVDYLFAYLDRMSRDWREENMEEETLSSFGGSHKYYFGNETDEEIFSPSSDDHSVKRNESVGETVSLSGEMSSQKENTSSPYWNNNYASSVNKIMTSPPSEWKDSLIDEHTIPPPSEWRDNSVESINALCHSNTNQEEEEIMPLPLGRRNSWLSEELSILPPDGWQDSNRNVVSGLGTDFRRDPGPSPSLTTSRDHSCAYGEKDTKILVQIIREAGNTEIRDEIMETCFIHFRRDADCKFCGVRNAESSEFTGRNVNSRKDLGFVVKAFNGDDEFEKYEEMSTYL